MDYILKSDEIYLENEVISGAVRINNGLISEVGNICDLDSYNIIDLKGLKLLPGFLDIHVHGGNGYDTMDGTYDAIEELSKFKILEGVTSFCPTTVTASDAMTKNAISNVKYCMLKGVPGAKIIGTFLEGPYINKDFKGAHPLQFIKEVNLDEIEKLIHFGEGSIKSFAIAPELPNAIDAIKLLGEKGVCARIGHSAATSDETLAGINAGANIAIHAFNAMTCFNHRSPGMVGAILANDIVYCEIICDLVHVDKVAVEVLVKCKKNKVILITDCMVAGGLCDGNYMLGELDVVVKDSIARISNGALAGSTLSIINAVKNMNKTVGIDLLEVVKMATINPAKALGINSTIGSIAVSKHADLVAIDHDFNVKFVMVNGKILLNNGIML